MDEEVNTEKADKQLKEVSAEESKTEKSSETSVNRQHNTTVTPSATPEELVTQGVSFLSGLAQTLQSPEATERLVNTLVETNEQTGESILRIPVPDKQTVTSLLSLVGKLFGGK